MALARIKSKIFNECDIVIIQRESRVSSYGGGKTNRWLPARVFNKKAMVEIYGRWFIVDPNDWDTDPYCAFDNVRHKIVIGSSSQYR